MVLLLTFPQLLTDDCLLYIELSIPTHDCTQLQNDLDCLSSWAFNYQTQFNEIKFVSMCHVLH